MMIPNNLHTERKRTRDENSPHQRVQRLDPLPIHPGIVPILALLLLEQDHAAVAQRPVAPLERADEGIERIGPGRLVDVVEVGG